MGLVGGSAYYGYKGWRHASRGEKRKGMWVSVVKNGPKTGGSFGAWGLVFTTYDAAFAHLRGVDGATNAIAAGTMTGATLAIRAGLPAMKTNAMIGGCLLTLIEALGYVLQKSFSDNVRRMHSLHPDNFFVYDKYVSKKQKEGLPPVPPLPYKNTVTKGIKYQERRQIPRLGRQNEFTPSDDFNYVVIEEDLK